MSLAEVKSFLSAMSSRYNDWFCLMGRSRMGLTSDWTIYLTVLMVSPGVMSHLSHAALLWTRMTSVLFIMLFIQSCLFKANASQEEARKTVLLLFHMDDLLCSRVFSSGGYYKDHPEVFWSIHWDLKLNRLLLENTLVQLIYHGVCRFGGFFHALHGTKRRKRMVLRDIVVITFSWLSTLLYVICYVQYKGKIILKYSICKRSY